MTDRYRRAMDEPPEFSNARDPNADRLGAYPDGGEVDSAQDDARATGEGSLPPQPAGTDSAVIFTGASGRNLGGPSATDPPGQAPGLPGPEGDPADDPDGPPAEGTGSFVDRLDR